MTIEPNQSLAPKPPEGNVIAFPGTGPFYQRTTPPGRLTESYPFAEAAALVETYIGQDFPGVKGHTRTTHRRYLGYAMERMTFAGYSAFSAESIAYLSNHVSEELSSESVQKYAKVVRRFTRWLYNMGHTEYCLGEHVRWRGGKAMPPRLPITQDEYHLIRTAAAGTQYDWLAVLGWHTGMSLIDACLLQWGEIDFHECVIRKSREKNGTHFIVPYQPEDDLGMALRARRDALPTAGPMDYVEPWLAAKILPPESEAKVNGCHGRASEISTGFATFCRRIGIPPYKSYHGFRRAFVSALANSNLNTAIASKMSGHLDPRIFAKYVTPDVEVLRSGLIEAQARHLGLALSAPPATVLAPAKTFTGGGSRRLHPLRPNTVYELRYGFPRLPGNLIVRHVKTGESTGMCEREVVVTPCDLAGNPIYYQNIVVYSVKLRAPKGNPA